MMMLGCLESQLSDRLRTMPSSKAVWRGSSLLRNVLLTFTAQKHQMQRYKAQDDFSDTKYYCRWKTFQQDVTN